MAIEPFQDTDLMPFGKHKGEPMSDVPARYLFYLWNNGLKAQVRTHRVAAYIWENLDALVQEDQDTIVDRQP